MGIFSKILNIFDKTTPHQALLEEYLRLHELSTLLHEELSVLTSMHSLLVETHSAFAGPGDKTFRIGLEKTKFVSEELMAKLKVLSKIAERRFKSASKDISQTEPVSELEKSEMLQVQQYLQAIASSLPDIKSILKLTDTTKKINELEEALRKITKIGKEFHEQELKEKYLVRKVRENEISPLLKKIYRKPQVRTFTFQSQSTPLFTFTLTPYQLASLQKEAERINSCDDPNYRIVWNRWWRDVQIPEKDKNTALKDPHINVTIRLFGERKRNVHLLLAA